MGRKLGSTVTKSEGSRRDDPQAKTKPKETASQASMMASWDLRAHCSFCETEDPYEFMCLLTPYCKKWGFQLEKCPESGNLHWQGRGLLIKQLRPGSTAAAAAAAMKLQYFKPTHKEEYVKGGFNYQLKAETRVAGPWTDKDPPLHKTTDVKYIESLPTMPLFLTKLIEWLAQPPDPRKIWCVVDRLGNFGKSAAESYLHFYKHACMLPYAPSYKDMLQNAYGLSGKRAYVINIVRAIDGNDPKQRHDFGMFLGAVESIKDGKVHDGRHHARPVVMFDRPHVLMFMNHLPILNKASHDKWMVFEITEDADLKDITVEVVQKHKANMEIIHNKYKEKREMDEAQHAMKWSKHLGTPIPVPVAVATIGNNNITNITNTTTNTTSNVIVNMDASQPSSHNEQLARLCAKTYVCELLHNVQTNIGLPTKAEDRGEPEGEPDSKRSKTEVKETTFVNHGSIEWMRAMGHIGPHRPHINCA